MRFPTPVRLVLLLTLVLAPSARLRAGIPLSEHPRPDFQRAAWANLNGPWDFRFDQDDAGLAARWFAGQTEFPEKIMVPFPWGSKLSGLGKKADIGWYRRTLHLPEAWRGQRVFLVIGACDWQTQGWLDGQPLGSHQGGYTPFEFELTSQIKWGQDQQFVLRVDDTPHPFKLEGKQGYGEAKGIWQTVYLEARPAVHITSVHFSPDIDHEKVTVDVQLSDPAPAGAQVDVHLAVVPTITVAHPVEAGARTMRFDVPVASPHLWSLEDPFLYEVDVVFRTPAGQDGILSYFGMRTISVERLPGTDIPYVALNRKPVYLQMTLDQSYHPDGFYTFPSDEFMRDEILRSKKIGLNANRIHIKVEVPRKLYWADKLGLLIMADVPNFWGEPTPEARTESEAALRGMITRDFNHPAIFSWVTFNETWGLFTGKDAAKKYLPETQAWVASMYHLAKQLDPTRLVEDNSACNYDHVETDLNSWHDYLPGYAWKDKLAQVVRDTHPGSAWNFIGGNQQGNQPMLNSECGNVWGYDGSTGDVDWSWDYHIMMNEFRRQPKVAGWLYTEHHDVINEWNGYYRFDRSEKETGLGELAPGMTLNDLHSAFYISTGSDLCRDVKPGETVSVPLFASFLTDRAPTGKLLLRTELTGWNSLGQRETYGAARQPVAFAPWLAQELPPLGVTMPDHPALAVLTLMLETEAGQVLQRNFTTFFVTRGPAANNDPIPGKHVLRFAPNSFSAAAWSGRQWNVLDGLKVNGAGHGYFEYRLTWPAGLDPQAVESVWFLCEASSKPLLGKDRADTAKDTGDYMRGAGAHDPSANPNAYPMTDTSLHPSAVRVRVNGIDAGTTFLPDDPADSRGVLSWHAQLRDRKLREAGSYGYLVNVTLPPAALAAAAQAKEIVLRLEVDGEGGLALYGERFGRYPLDPTLVFELK